MVDYQIQKNQYKSGLLKNMLNLVVHNKIHLNVKEKM